MFFFIAVLTASCNNKGKDIDLSKIRLDLQIQRFDQEMGELTPGNLSEKAPLLHRKYGAFYEDYMDKMLNAGSTKDTAYYQNLRVVLTHPDYKALKSEVDATFPDLKRYNEELTEAFKRVKYYFPEQKIPRLVSFLSGFAVQVPIGNDYIGIGLDMFLGADSRFYPALRESIPQYLSRRFTPQNITPRVIETFVREGMFPERDSDKAFVDRMIYNGKIMYFMKALLPEVPDSVIIGYTAAQQKWSENFESGTWGFFLQHDLLYETDYMKIQKFLSEAPFTPGIGNGNESAPKLGVFTGWQIVKKYMARNPDISIPQLMKNTDYQEILKQSHYKPK